LAEVEEVFIPSCLALFVGLCRELAHKGWHGWGYVEKIVDKQENGTI
jgi:hypothetical protein